MVTSKQLLPIYDKPMIYYPMSVLMNAGIRDILIISTPQDTPRFEELLGDGHQFGVNLTYAVQPSPDGLAQAFIIGEEFIGNDTVCMVLGDNIFAGHGLKKRLKAAVDNAETGKGATVFGYYVDDPERFGIVEFDQNGKAVSIEEKPEKPKSNYCVTGLYFYDNKVVEYAKNLKPSARGELEITDLNRIYLEKGQLNVELLGQGFTWVDTGTHESLVEATNFVKTMEQHQHRKIACLEEIAYLNGWITKEDVLKVYEILKKNQYGQYLKDVLDGKSDSAETAITVEKDVCVSDAFVKKPQIIRSTHNIGVRGEHFEVMFSVLNGGLVSYKYAGKEMIEAIPKPNFWRAPTDNDCGNLMQMRYAQWKIASMYLSHKEYRKSG